MQPHVFFFSFSLCHPSINVMVFTLTATVFFFFLMGQDEKLQRMAGVTHRKVTGELLEVRVREAFNTPLAL